MGTLTKVRYFERVEIVLNPDGTLKGAMGAEIQGIAEDGVLLPGAAMFTIGLSADDLAKVLPDNSKLLAQIADQQNAMTALSARLNSATQELEATKAALKRLQDAVASADVK